MQIVFASLHADYVLLYLPNHLTISTQKGQQKGAEVAADGQLLLNTIEMQYKAQTNENQILARRLHPRDSSEHESVAALQSRTIDIKTAILQATMISAYQAHQHSRHPSKISVFLTLDHDELKMEAPQHDTINNKSLGKECRAVLIAMHKTLYKECRDICGPAIYHHSASLTRDLQVCFYHSQHPSGHLMSHIVFICDVSQSSRSSQRACVMTCRIFSTFLIVLQDGKSACKVDWYVRSDWSQCQCLWIETWYACFQPRLL